VKDGDGDTFSECFWTGRYSRSSARIAGLKITETGALGTDGLPK